MAGYSHVPCAVCGSEEWQCVYSSRQNVSDVAGEVSVDLAMCLSCGFLFNNPQPDQELLDAHYAINSSGVVFKEVGPDSRTGRLTRLRHEFVTGQLVGGSPGRILDVGCGNGFFLQSLDAPGWHKTGIDLAPQRGRNVADQEIELVTGNILDFAPDQLFDIITCFSAFEHFRLPDVMLRKLRSLLKPDGRVIIDVPDTAHPVPGLEEFFCFEHLSSFTRPTLTMFFNNNGFEVLDFAQPTPEFQSLLCSARPTEARLQQMVEDPSRVQQIIGDFRTANESLQETIREKLKSALAPIEKEGGRIAVYGAGFHNYFLFNLYPFEDLVAMFIDGDQNKWGQELRGKPIVSPQEIATLPVQAILISSHHFENEIFDTIARFNQAQLPVFKLYEEEYGARSSGAVVCLAAGPAQIPVIRKAQELGYQVIAVDRDPEAPGLAQADRQILASTYESQPIIDQLRDLSLDGELRGVINRSSGIPVLTAAAISQAFNLPSPTPAVAEQLTSKSSLLETCRQGGIAVPSFQSLAAHEAPDQEAISFPCVVKPAISLVGKSGIHLVKNPAQLPAALAAARRASMNGWVNIEEFVPGSDVSLVAVVADEKVYPLLWKDELNSFQSDGTVQFAGVAVPSVYAGRPEAEKILRMAEKLAQHLPLGRTVLNLSCRCEPGGDPVITEVHLDLGGDHFFEGLLPHCTTDDMLGNLIRFLTGSRATLPQINLQPTALVFSEDDHGSPTRPFTIIKASSRAELSRLLDQH